MTMLRDAARYQRREKAGFMPFEAKALKDLPSTAPYVKMLERERALLARQYKGQKAKLTRLLYDTYTTEGWLDKKGGADPWQMIRAYEDKYRAKHPQYTSPWQKAGKRVVTSQEFRDKAERTIARQRKEALKHGR